MKLILTSMIALAVATAGCSKSEAPAAPENDVAATPAAATGIAGTWIADPATNQYEVKKPVSLLIKDGTYTCNSCIPPFSTPADGKVHAVQRPVADELQVTVVDDKTVEVVSRKAGKEIAKGKWTVSADGQSATNEAWEAAVGDGKESRSKATFARKAPAPAGAHALSGDWQIAKVDEVDEASRTFAITMEGDTFGLSANGESYSAKLGGPAVPINGSLGGAMAAVEKVSDTEYVETITRKGEVIGKNRIVLNPDGTMSVEYTDPRNGNVTRQTARRG